MARGKQYRCLGSFFPTPKGYESFCIACQHKKAHRSVHKIADKPTMFMCNHTHYAAGVYYRCLCYPIKEAARIAFLIKMGAAEFKKTWCDYD